MGFSSPVEGGTPSPSNCIRQNDLSFMCKHVIFIFWHFSLRMKRIYEWNFMVYKSIELVDPLKCVFEKIYKWFLSFAKQGLNYILAFQMDQYAILGHIY